MSDTSYSPQPCEADRTRPWWRYPIVWLVIGGPALVVVASLITMAVAIKHVDPVLDTSAGQVKSPNEKPAIQGRNHAAEPSVQPADR